MIKKISEGNGWTKLRNAYQYWDSLHPEDELRKSAYSVVLALLKVYNSSCEDPLEELEAEYLDWAFGD